MKDQIKIEFWAHREKNFQKEADKQFSLRYSEKIIDGVCEKVEFQPNGNIGVGMCEETFRAKEWYENRGIEWTVDMLIDFVVGAYNFGG